MPSEKETTDLKRCPFCGGRPFVERGTICVYYVRCDGYAAHGAPVEAMRYEWDEPAAHKAAAKAWNRRKAA